MVTSNIHELQRRNKVLENRVAELTRERDEWAGLAGTHAGTIELITRERDEHAALIERLKADGAVTGTHAATIESLTRERDELKAEVDELKRIVPMDEINKLQAEIAAVKAQSSRGAVDGVNNDTLGRDIGANIE